MISVPNDKAMAEAAWEGVLGWLEERRKFSLLGPFQHARVLAWTSEQLVLGFLPDVHAMGEMAADRDRLLDFEECIEAILDHSPKVRIRLLEHGGRKPRPVGPSIRAIRVIAVGPGHTETLLEIAVPPDHSTHEVLINDSVWGVWLQRFDDSPTEVTESFEFKTTERPF